MNDFQPGDLVAFDTDGTCRFGLISGPNDNGTHNIIDDSDTSTWAVGTDRIVHLPNRTPLPFIGDRVQVRDDAPHYARCVGRVEGPSIRDGMFGYWLRLDHTDEHAWVPAQALIPLEQTEDGGRP